METIIRESAYNYSSPIIIREWPGGGSISVIVGYVRKYPERNSIVLSKRWTGVNGLQESKFYIKAGSDWLKIKQAVEKLWPELDQTQTPEEIDSAIRKVSKEVNLLELFARYPNLLKQIPENINILSLPEDQKESLNNFLSAGGELANLIISELSKQPVSDLEGFSKILDKLKLSTINSLVTHVTSRIGFIDIFEKVVRDDNSYEIRGQESVHNLLKSNIWMVNRNFSVLHDDETLRSIIATEWEKENHPSEHGKLRLDFLCMVNQLEEQQGQRNLVIIEIKRPSVVINMDHLNQVW